MTTRAISLLLILTLGAGVLSGMPLHSNEETCSMHGMSGMDCCKTAKLQGIESDIAAARICCAVNCPQSGTTNPSSGQLPKMATALVAVYPVVVHAEISTTFSFCVPNRSHSPPQGSKPAYIRNLALLI
jgi:hypothetical protein